MLLHSKPNLKYIDLSNMDTSNVTNLYEGFYETGGMFYVDGLDNFNTSNVTSMHNIFNHAHIFTGANTVLNWDVSNCTDLSSLGGTESSYFAGLNFNLYRSENARTANLYRMYYNCTLGGVNLTNFSFNNINSTAYMFYSTRFISSNNCYLNLGNSDFSSVTNMDWMFGRLVVNPRKDWMFGGRIKNVNNVVSAIGALDSSVIQGSVFSNCYFENVQNVQFMFRNQTLSYFMNLKFGNNIYNASQMFNTAFISRVTSPDLSFNLDNCINTSGMFYNAYINTCSIHTFNFSNLLDATDMFRLCKSSDRTTNGVYLQSGSGFISELDLSNLKYGNRMFAESNCIRTYYMQLCNMNNLIACTDMFYRANIGNQYLGLIVDIKNSSGIVPVDDRMFKDSSLQSINLINSPINIANKIEYVSDLPRLETVVLAGANTESVTSIQMKNLPKLCTINLNGCNLDNLVNMDSAFYNCANLSNLVLDGSNWNITNFQTTFKYSGITSDVFKNIWNWNFNNAVNMYGMFANTYLLGDINLYDKNFENCLNMRQLFYSSDVAEINIDNMIFGNTDVGQMISTCNKLKAVRISNSILTNISAGGYLSYNLFDLIGLTQCTNLSVLNLCNLSLPSNRNLGSVCFNVSGTNPTVWANLKAVNISNCSSDSVDGAITVLGGTLLNNVSSLESVYMSNLTLNYTSCVIYLANNIKDIYMKNINILTPTTNAPVIVDGSYLAMDTHVADIRCENVIFPTVINIGISTDSGLMRELKNYNAIELENFDFPMASNIGYFMLRNIMANSISLNNWNLSNVTNSFRVGMSITADNLVVDNWNLCNINSVSSAFANINTNNLSITNWNVINASSIIGLCTNIRPLKNLNLDNWNVENVTEASSIFAQCNNLKTISTKGWRLKNVSGLVSAFANCFNLESVNLCHWGITNKLNIASQMFWNCTSLVNVDISNWDVSGMTNAYRMFSACRNLKNINVSNWMIQNCNIGQMFRDCNNLSDASLDSIINMCINAVNLPIDRNLNPYYVWSPLYGIANTRYRNRWSDLTNAGWAY